MTMEIVQERLIRDPQSGAKIVIRETLNDSCVFIESIGYAGAKYARLNFDTLRTVIEELSRAERKLAELRVNGVI